MSLVAGTKFGPYEIVAPIGAGGMGEVYRAADTRLGRDVALKVLPQQFASDTDRLHRFEQEARAVAALNHPNILAVFDIGQQNGSSFLVSELLEGESLRTALDRGALPPRKTIEFGVQIAQGLAAAHEKGIVHRDLKPENIFITKDGRVKILDFGLAKLAQKAGGTSVELDSVTVTSSHTAAGVVMGTASYMAPEQVRGQAADPRTDIFAFGAVLYEMLSGKRAFRRDTSAETMTAVLKEDPPEISDSTRAVSPALDRIVRRCLEKNPEQRFQSARDLSFALSALSGTDASGLTRVPEGPRKSSLRLWLAAVVVLAAACAVTWFVARRPAPVARMQFAIPVPGEVSHMALSNDGSVITFVAPEENSGVSMLYIQRIGAPNATLLPGTEGASFPFWSPDAAYVGFFANDKLKKIAVAGGTPQVLANAYEARGGSWGSRGVIVYAPNVGLSIWRINADGTGAAPLTDTLFLKDEQTHRWPVFLPDGENFLFWAGNFSNASDDKVSGIYVSSIDKQKKERRLVVLTHSCALYDSGHLYYTDGQRQLLTVPFDLSKATVSGSATVAVNSVGFQPATYWAAFSVAQNGTLVYSTSTGAVVSELTWMDRSGKELSRVGQPGIIANPTISPDGRRVSIDITDQKANNVDVWLMTLSGGGNSRFTFDPAEEVAGVWSRDGETLAYRRVTAGGMKIILKRTSGLEHEKEGLAINGADDAVPNSWSLDDQQILCTYLSSSGTRLQILSLSAGKFTLFLTSAGNQSNGMISPDGKWAAYVSDELGSPEVYVTNFPGAAGRWQVSRGGGTEPRWRADGKEIFYLDPKGILTAIPVTTTADSFSTGNPTPLFQIHGRAIISSTDIFTYDVAKDGNRFLVNRYVKPERVAPLTIVLHAAAERDN
ncbi:MAG: protein kinase domain-containing protein [Candidatus Acidiferrales bacterium]